MIPLRQIQVHEIHHGKGLDVRLSLAVALSTIQFVQTRGMPNSPSQMIPDRLDWRQIWGSGRSNKGSNSADTVLGHPCHVRPTIIKKLLVGAIA
ncbi:hypothetical protein TNCV_3610051 [Trichonephila clavipes]|nr:hypothetical protein TNCV_3610051 [Trichonephila clavipes]